MAEKSMVADMTAYQSEVAGKSLFQLSTAVKKENIVKCCVVNSFCFLDMPQKKSVALSKVRIA